MVFRGGLAQIVRTWKRTCFESNKEEGRGLVGSLCMLNSHLLGTLTKRAVVYEAERLLASQYCGISSHQLMQLNPAPLTSNNISMWTKSG